MATELIYIRLDDLTRYVIDYYPHLMTFHEAAAYRSVMLEEKAQHSDSPAMQRMLWRTAVSNVPEVRKLLEARPEQFMVNVRDRILREHADQVFLNLCSRCNHLARTPTAKQCPHCFHSWHDPA